MKPMGRAIWSLPAWLGRILPVEIEQSRRCHDCVLGTTPDSSKQ